MKVLSDWIKTEQQLSADVAANSITRMVFVFCTGDIYPQGEQDLELKLEPPVLSMFGETALEPGKNGKHVSTTVSVSHAVTVGDSDISKGVTTQTRRKGKRFLAGQK